MKNNDTRPFDIISAKAGAPYACRNGNPATILKWDAKGNDFPLIGLVDRSGGEMPENWTVEGCASITREPRDADLVMTPLGYIDDKPVFVGDKFRYADGSESKATPNMRYFDDCLWPAPAKQYPVTGMTDDETMASIKGIMVPSEMRRAIANAALRHAIDNGQVITMKDHADKLAEVGRKVAAITSPDLSVFAQASHWQEPISGIGTISGVKEVVQAVKKIVEGRAARDMAIAKAVLETCYGIAQGHHMRTGVLDVMDRLDLAAIIASVKDQV